MKKKPDIKLIKLVLSIIILILFAWIIVSTYSKYTNGLGSSVKAKMSNWNIKINNQDITDESDFTNVLNFQLDSDSNVAANVIVPTSKGTCSLTIDSTGTDLPYEYTISVNEEVNELVDFRIVKYKLNSGPEVTVPAGQYSITGSVNPSLDANGNNTGNTVSNTYQLWAEWYDSNDNVLDNANDTRVSKKSGIKGSIPIKVSVSQVQP